MQAFHSLKYLVIELGVRTHVVPKPVVEIEDYTTVYFVFAFVWFSEGV